MANGKVHQRVNLVGLIVSTALVSYWKTSVFGIVLFLFGYLFATYIFSPDSDLGPKKSLSIFGLLIAPYALFFKHRGLSHHPLWGTLTRVVYLGILFFLISLTLKLTDITPVFAQFFHKSILLAWDGAYSSRDLQLFGMFILGMIISDWTHLLLDYLSSFYKKYLK